MVATEIVSYGLMFCVALVFSILSLGQLMQRKQALVDYLTPILSGVSCIAWWILIPLHLAFIGGASAFLSAPAILWFAFGVIFLLLTILRLIWNTQGAVLSAGRVDTVE